MMPSFSSEFENSGMDSETTTLILGDCGDIKECTTRLEVVLGSLASGMSVTNVSHELNAVMSSSKRYAGFIGVQFKI
jgi:hypothetical protein